MKHAADCMTLSRVALGIALLLCKPFSVTFYGVYIAAGVTDMLDGTVARRTGTAGKQGALFDSLADAALALACFAALLPHLCLPLWLWLWACGLAALRIGFTVCELKKYKTVFHTLWDKAAGVALFLFPFYPTAWLGAAVSAVATAAAASHIFCKRRSAHEQNKHYRQP